MHALPWALLTLLALGLLAAIACTTRGDRVALLTDAACLWAALLLAALPLILARS
ncbi:hypothetical protein [Kitasatospora indigofera]|uniref:hypothetical protein n=1 Tax=Kitasatospora indigofera TaxID=67307 RepID=UPI00367B1571